MDKSPLVSVVIPSLNRARYLKETIDSVLSQDYPGIECIVVDGGSTDNTIEILRKYGNRVKWIVQTNNGHADSINIGWKMSKGSILAWLNADDCYAVPDAISKAAEYFQNNSDIDVVYGNYAVISEDGKALSGVLTPREWDLEYAVKYCFYTITQPASFIRRPILEKVNWLDVESSPGDDHDLWLRIGPVGKIRYVPIFLAYIRDCRGITQGKNTARCRVRLTKKFFNNTNLSTPFNSKHFQRRAMSNSCLVGSNFALLGPYYKEFITYFLRAIIIDPANLLYIMMKTGRTIFSIAIPRNLKNAIKIYILARQSGKPQNS